MVAGQRVDVGRVGVGGEPEQAEATAVPADIADLKRRLAGDRGVVSNEGDGKAGIGELRGERADGGDNRRDRFGGDAFDPDVVLATAWAIRRSTSSAGRAR